MGFRVGMKVICVDDDWYGPHDLPLPMLEFVKNLPVKGNVYRVRSINSDDPVAFILLAEIINPLPPEPHDEVHFNSEYFRPVVETSIAIFEEMLTPSSRQLVE